MLPMKVNKMLYYYHHQLYRPSVLMATCLITYDCTLSLAVPQTQTHSHTVLLIITSVAYSV